MGLDKLRKDELKARERVPDLDQRAHVNFAAILSSSVKQGFESLSKSNSSLVERNVLSSAAGNLSRQQMPSEVELHSLQQYRHLTTKLRATGADVRPIVKSTVDRGIISKGMSQEVAKTLLRAEKLRHQSANK